MRVPTVTIRQDRTGKILKVNAQDYALNMMGRYSGWSLLKEQHNEAEPPPAVEPEPEPITEEEDEEDDDDGGYRL